MPKITLERIKLKLKLPDLNTFIKLNNQDSGINLKIDKEITEEVLFISLHIKKLTQMNHRYKISIRKHSRVGCSSSCF